MAEPALFRIRIMAFEFKKEPERNAGGISNPFDNTSDSSRRSSGAGFSFGKTGGNKSESRQPSADHAYGGGPSVGFQFSREKKKNEKGAGFSDLPAHYNGGRQTRDFPERRDFPQYGGRRKQGFGLDEIPWKPIIYFILIITVVLLIVIYWDEIVYVMYNLIILLIALIVLVILLKILFRRRR